MTDIPEQEISWEEYRESVINKRPIIRFTVNDDMFKGYLKIEDKNRVWITCT